MKQEVKEEMKDNSFASQTMIHLFWFCRGDNSKNTTLSESILLHIPNVNERQEKQIFLKTATLTQNNFRGVANINTALAVYWCPE